MLLAPLAMAVVVLAAALQVNAYYGSYRTLADLTGASVADIPALPAGSAAPPAAAARAVPAPPAAAAAQAWVRPEGLPQTGTVNSVRIPGTVSGFAARTGFVYLPPAYQAPSPSRAAG